MKNNEFKILNAIFHLQENKNKCLIEIIQKILLTHFNLYNIKMIIKK